MSAITELAERLGKTIADSPAAVALREAKQALDAQPEVKKLLDEFQKHSDKIAQLQEDNKPVEVEDKHKLRELETKLLASEVFKKLTAAQVEYIDQMRKVNDALRKHLIETEGGKN